MFLSDICSQLLLKILAMNLPIVAEGVLKVAAMLIPHVQHFIQGRLMD